MNRPLDKEQRTTYRERAPRKRLAIILAGIAIAALIIILLLQTALKENTKKERASAGGSPPARAGIPPDPAARERSTTWLERVFESKGAATRPREQRTTPQPEQANLTIAPSRTKTGFPFAEGRRYDVTIRGIPGGELSLKNLSYRDEDRIGIDAIPPEKSMPPPAGKTILKSYAVDLSGLSFEKATLRVVATGSELFKCKEWDFASESCRGLWISIAALTPGTAYTLDLTPDDPAFAEVGVTSINTEKPIYHPQEDVAMTIVVLNTEGHLVRGALINLTIILPDETAMQVDTIVEKDRGIYEAHLTPNLTGNYTLFVHAIAPGTDAHLSSHFLVLYSYPFDIIRHAPQTIDPWQGETQIEIMTTALDNIPGPWNLTERLPESITITSTGEGTITTTGTGTYIHWTGLHNGSTASYAFQAPLRAPELYLLGPAHIDYADGDSRRQFFEARPWFLAADPTNLTLTAVADAMLDENSPTRNFGTTNPISVYVRLTRNRRDLFLFDLSTIPQGVNIDTASLELYMSAAPSSSRTYGIHRVTSSWNEGTGSNAVNSAVINGSTWNERWFNQAWGTVGGDFTPLATATTATGTSIAYLYWNATPDVVAWYAGTAANNGFILKDETEDDTKTGGSFQTRTGPTPSRYPHLVITYTDITAPVVALTLPVNNSIINNDTVDFNFTVSDNVDTAIPLCALWTNKSGTWAANKTSTSITNGTQNNITLANINDIPDGFYQWNVICNDTASNGNFSPQNFTILFNLQAPLINGSAFNQTTIYTDDAIRFNVTIIDPANVSSANLTFHSPGGTTSFVNLAKLAGDTWSFSPSSTSANGSYWVSAIWAFDSTAKVAKNTSINISFTVLSDSTLPAILNLSPQDSWTSTTPNVNYTFNATDDRPQNLKNCSLIANFSGTLAVVSTMDAVVQGINHTFSINNTEDGTYSWAVRCYDARDNQNTSEFRTITIHAEGPFINLPSFNRTSADQGELVRFNATVNSTQTVTSAWMIITYPNATTGNISLTKEGTVYTRTFNESLAGTYNVTSIVATDALGRTTNETRYNLFFTIVATPPSAFGLTSPATGTNTTALSNTLSWEPSHDATFANYTVLVDTDPGFASPDFTYMTTSPSQTFVTAGPLNPDTVYSWHVIAYDTYGNSRNATSAFTYTTYNAPPVVELLYPNDHSWHPDTNVTFVYRATDVNPGVCAILTNISGAFIQEKYASVPSGLNTFTIETIPENTTFTWNIQCNDTLGRTAFAAANWTLSISGPEAYRTNQTVGSAIAINNMPPQVIQIAAGPAIDLTAGTTKNVTFTATFSDDNGVGDLKGINATWYHFGNTTLESADNATNHYSTNCTWRNVTSLIVNASCSFDVWFFANNGTWTINVTAEDQDGATGTGSENATVNELLAIDVNTTTLSYGNTAVETTTEDVPLTVINLGNKVFDLSLFGFGMAENDTLSFACPIGNISIGDERYSTTAGTPWAAMTPIAGLSGSPNFINATIPKTVTPLGNSSYGMFFKLSIPSTAFGACNGSLALAGVVDT